MVKNTKRETRSLVIQQIALTSQQLGLIQATTPPEFIKTRVVRGKGTAKYVEGGYIIARLNQIFGAMNWNWEVLEHGENARKSLGEKAEGEVWVRGRLTIKDHKNGYAIFKDAFGQHPIYLGVPFGDSLKSASTDAMKKAAASGFGIALDVYWQQLDQDKLNGDTKIKAAPQTATEKKEQAISLLQLSRDKITKESDPQILVEWRQKIHDAKQYTGEEKIELMMIINKKIKHGGTQPQLI